MDLTQLASFDRIVREGSFSRAAQYLGVSQATISGRIQVLEAEIGAPLFVRGGRRVALSGAGEIFLPYARRALAVLAEGMEAAREEPSGRHGRVTIGAIDSVVEGLLARAVARFRRDHPQTILSVRSGHTPQIVRELADGTVRLGLVTWSYVQGTVELDVILRLREPLVPVAAPGHPLTRRAELTIDQLIADADPYHDTAWGTPDDARIAGLAQRSWADHELPHGLMRQLILRGIGAGFLPRSIAEDDLAAGRLAALPVVDAAGLAREVALVCHESAATLPPSSLDFVAAVRAEATAMGMLGTES